MQRRRLLSVVGCALAATAGCIEDRAPVGDENGDPEPENGSDGDEDAVAGALDDWDLVVGVDSSAEPDEYPSVEFGEDAVTVTGRMLVGSSSCKTVAATTVDYDADAARLDVVVEDAEAEDDSPEDEPRNCTDDISSESYELTAQFDESVPETVRAVEDLRDARREIIVGRDGVRDRSSDGPTTVESPPEGIDDITLEVDRGSLEAVGESPEISIEDTVTVEGTLVVGSSSCKTTGVTDLSYDADAAELDLTVEDVEVDDADGACTADESVDDYRLTIEFAGSTPTTVSMTERGREGTRSVSVAQNSASEDAGQGS